MSEPRFVAATLRWCNDMRAERNMEPLAVLPKGKRNDPLSCPCGAATELHVEFDTAYPPCENWYDQSPVATLPSPVMEFVEAFDNGELPQYDEAA